MMKKEILSVLEGLVLEEGNSLTLRQLCRVCSVHAECIIELVDEGILEPIGTAAEQYRFHGDSLRRAQKAFRLQRDLGINLAGVALTLDLLEEIEQLRSRLRFLESGWRERDTDILKK